jgi:hypothetical protein
MPATPQPGPLLPSRQGTRSASILVEFSLIALVLFFLLAALLDFGRATVSAQVLTQAADFIAQELSRVPMSVKASSKELLDDRQVQTTIFSPGALVIPLPSSVINGDKGLMDYLDKDLDPPLPMGNRLLIPLMIFDKEKRKFYYPGKIEKMDATKTVHLKYSDEYVTIPIVSYPSEGKEEIIKYVDVLEPIILKEDYDPFKLTSTDTSKPKGLVAIRMNFPFQAASFVATNPPEGGPTKPIAAAIEPSTDVSNEFGPYAGPEGLGQMVALTKTVRPFRRVLSAQAIYRREIMLP